MGSILLALADFCDEIAPEGSLVGAELRPGRVALPLRCYWNVKKRVRNSGGRNVGGWMFMAVTVDGMPTAIVALHHFVWQNKAGEFVDVTPHEEGGRRFLRWDERTLAFLTDPKAKLILDAIPLPTKLFPLTQDKRALAHVEYAVAEMNEDRFGLP